MTLKRMSKPQTLVGGTIEIGSGKGAIFVQDAPGLPVRFLGCHGLSGLSADRGTNEYGWCLIDGQYFIRSITKTPPGGTTFDIMAGLTSNPSPLEVLEGCLATYYVIHSTCGRPSKFCDFERASVIPYSRINTEDGGDQVGWNEDTRIERTFSVSSPLPYTKAFRPVWENIGFALPDTETALDAGTLPTAALDITGEDACAGECGPRSTACDWILVGSTSEGGDAEAPVAAIFVSKDTGLTWYAKEIVDTAGDPILTPNIDFAIRLPDDKFLAIPHTSTAGGDLIAFIGDLDPDVIGVESIVIGAVGTTNVAVTDFYAVGSEVWLTLNTGASPTGRVYYSADGGLTWELQLTATTADTIVAIDFFGDTGYAVGMDAGNAPNIYKTTNAGIGWTLLTTVGLPSSAINDAFVTSGYLWVSNALGLYRSGDGGKNWTRLLTGASGSISFYDDYFGVAIVGGKVYYTITGGAPETWCLLSSQPAFLDASPVILDVVACSPSSFYLLATDGTNVSTAISKYALVTQA